jgi:hypothetical protein
MGVSIIQENPAGINQKVTRSDKRTGLSCGNKARKKQGKLSGGPGGHLAVS